MINIEGFGEVYTEVGNGYLEIFPSTNMDPKLKSDIDFALYLLSRNPKNISQVSQHLLSNKYFMLKAIPICPSAFLQADDRLQDDYQLVCLFVEHGGDVTSVNPKFRNNLEVVKSATRQGKAVLTNFLTKEMRGNEGVIREAVKHDPSSVELAPYEMLNDTSFLLELLFTNGLVLQYLPYELRQSPSMITAAVNQNQDSFEFVPLQLRQDWNFMYEMLFFSGCLLKYCPIEFQSDYDLVRRAVGNNGLALQYASEILRSDRQIVRIAVSNNPAALKFAIPIQYDFKFLDMIMSNTMFEFVDSSIKNLYVIYKIYLQQGKRFPFLKQIKNMPQLMKNMTTVERGDLDFMIECVKINPFTLEYASDNLKDCHELVQLACSLNGMALQFASTKLKSNKEIVMCAVKQDGHAINFALDFLGFKNILVEVVRTFPEVFSAIPLELDSFRNDIEVLMSALTHPNIKSQKVHPLTNASELLKDNTEVVLFSVKSYGMSLAFASDRLKQDKVLVTTALENNGLALQYAHADLRSDRDVVLAAVKQNPKAIEFSLAKTDNDREIMMEIVGQVGLSKCSSELKLDKEIVLRSLQYKGVGLYTSYVPVELQNDEDILIEGIKYDDVLITQLPDSVRKNKDYISKILETYGYLYSKIPQKLKNERSIVLAALSNYGMSLGCTNIEFRNDLEVVLTAVRNKGTAVHYVGKEFTPQELETIYMEAVKTTPFSIQYIKNPSRAVCLQAVKNDGKSIMFIKDPDEEMILEAVKNNPEAIHRVSILKYPGILTKLIEANEKVLVEIPHTLALYETDLIIRELAIVYNASAKYYSKIVTALKAYIEPSKVRHGKKLSEIVKQYSTKKLDKSQLIAFYDLISEVVTRENYNSKDLFLLCENAKIRLWWATNVKEVISRYTEAYVNNEKELLLCLCFSEFEQKTNTLFAKRTYSSSRVIELVLLMVFSNIILSNKLYKVNLQNVDHRGEKYYLLSDLVSKFISDLNQKVKETSASSLKETISLFALHKDKMMTGGTITDMQTNTFLADWVKMPSFPSLKSIHDLTTQNSKVNTFQNVRLYAKVISEKLPHYYCVSVLGTGGQGTVLKCYNSIENRFDAIKVVDSSGDEDTERWNRMFDFMRKDTPGIIKCYDCGIHLYKEISYKYFVMELGSESLQECVHKIHKKESNSILSKQSLLQIIEIFMEILKAVINLHNEHFTHRDLKLTNIVITNTGPKLIDFDSSRILQHNKSVTLNIGTFEYLAPELHDENEENLTENIFITQKSDIFSLGCIFLKMIINLPLKLSESGAKYGNHIFGNGFFFHVILSLASGQSKLHNAILTELDNFIDPSFKISNIIGRCIITMIQATSTFRGECILYLKIMEIVKEALISNTEPKVPKVLLDGLLDIDFELISDVHKENQLLVNENNKLVRNNQDLMETIINLRKQLGDSKQTITKLEERNEELQLQIGYLKEVLSDTCK